MFRRVRALPLAAAVGTLTVAAGLGLATESRAALPDVALCPAWLEDDRDRSCRCGSDSTPGFSATAATPGTAPRPMSGGFNPVAAPFAADALPPSAGGFSPPPGTAPGGSGGGTGAPQQTTLAALSPASEPSARGEPDPVTAPDPKDPIAKQPEPQPQPEQDDPLLDEEFVDEVVDKTASPPITPGQGGSYDSLPQQQEPTQQATAVPEPSSIWLLLTLGGLLCGHRLLTAARRPSPDTV